MKILKRSLLFIFLLACAGAYAQTPTLEPCEAQLPASLREALPKKFPEYRLARVTDYYKESVDQHKTENHGNPCLAVAAADVDGDGFSDFAFFLTQEKHTVLIAARHVSGKAWDISMIDDFGNEGPGRSYVEKIKAGSYQDIFDTDDAPSEYTPDPGRVRRYKASHFGFVAGTIESSGVAFFFTGKRWVHLWLSD